MGNIALMIAYKRIAVYKISHIIMLNCTWFNFKEKLTPPLISLIYGIRVSFSYFAHPKNMLSIFVTVYVTSCDNKSNYHSIAGRISVYLVDPFLIHFSLVVLFLMIYMICTNSARNSVSQKRKEL